MQPATESGQPEGAKYGIQLLVLLMLLHGVLATRLAQITPYRQAGAVLINPSREQDIGAPDERQHVNYVQHLYAGRGFPVFQPGAENLYETYQAHQPPLFYLLSTGWVKAAEFVGLAPQDSRPDPFAMPGESATLVPFPNGAVLRGLNAVIGMLGIAGVFFAALWGLRDERVALGAAAFAALLPMNVGLSSAVSNDPLLIALCSWVLALCAKGVRDGWTMPLAVGVGLLTAAALLTKTTALALLPVLLVALVLSRSHRPPAAAIAVCVALVALVPAAWWARNQQLYGDPLAIQAFNQAFTGSAQRSMLVEQVIPRTNPGSNPATTYWTHWVTWWTARSTLGVFGYMDIWLTKSGRQSPDFDENVIYWLAIALVVAAWIGACVSLVRRDETTTAERPVHLLGATLLLVVALLFLRFNTQYFQAQGRYLLPALAPMAVAVAVGIRHWFRVGTLPGMLNAALLGLTLLGMNAYALANVENWFQERIAAGRAMESAR
jgi:4-amino-4-deoxy-L-arabinose transferase-like glycosyltransferase